jgi:ribonuclease G
VVQEIVINVSEYETRVAILEDGKLVEILVERPENQKIAGNIYKGVVKSIFPGMQAAFVDVGIGKNCFLHVSDMGEFSDMARQMFDIEEAPEEESSRRRGHQGPPRIEHLLHKEQEILVQVTREAIGTKGPRVTTQLTLPGRYVVLIPGQNHVGTSKKIEDWQEKKRLKQILRELRNGDYGLIARTVGAGKSSREFRADIKNLLKAWNHIQKQARKKKGPYLLHRDVDLIGSIIRDLITTEVESIIIDHKPTFKRIIGYLKGVAPQLRSKVRLYEERMPLFDALGIEPEIEKMFHRKIWLKRGGYIVIDQTEALVTIDVNTGRFVGKQSQEDTILQTNLEACREIARQIRLRDIGGLIIVDFIDMTHRSNERRLYEEFKDAFRRDRAKNAFAPVSEFGLIEMTREKVGPSILHELSDPCPVCDGSGRVLSKETTALKIERWFKRAKAVSEERDYRLAINPVLSELMLSKEDNRLRDLNKQLRLNIELMTDRNLLPHEFKVFSVMENREITERFAG